MAHLLAIVDPHPAPYPETEHRALVYMSYAPALPPGEVPPHVPQGPGFRISVTAAETGRDVGRWVSECPLTVVQACLMWLSMSEWEVEPAQGSLDYMQVMDEVPHNAVNQPGAVPRDMVHLLAMNFPGSPPQQERESGITGPTGVRFLPAPISERAPVDLRRDLPGKFGPTAMGAKGPVHAQRLSGERVQLDEEEMELGRFLSRSMRALKRGASADQIIDAMSALVVESDEILLSPPEEVEPDHVVMPGAPNSVATDPQGYSETSGPREYFPQIEEPSYRPLMPGEVPQGLDPAELSALEALGSDDAALRVKFERTQNRAQEQIYRARRTAARNAAARNAAAQTIAEPEAPSEELNGETNGEVTFSVYEGYTKARLVSLLVDADSTLDTKMLMRRRRGELVDMCISNGRFT